MNVADSSLFALTTPLYYVNDLPHIGSAYTTIAADAAARFQRLQGKSVLLVTGTDEHGQKIQQTAEQLGRSPQQHADQVSGGFQQLWRQLEIRYDRFSRTTDPRHARIVQEFFQRVWDQGDIYLGQQRGWYCVACEEFKEERELLPEHFCALHPNRRAEWRDEENYFFRLSRYQDRLEALYAEQPDFIQPDYRRNEVLQFVKQGLRDFSISRLIDWGLPVPGNPQHTLYVWFDALLGYITALLEPEDEPTLANALQRWWPIDLHLIGKDILRFHAVYWPAMLISAQLPLPGKVFGHGFLTKDGQKMGKSLGNTLDPVALIGQYGADAVRYYFLKEIEFGRDGDFNETRFVQIVNADLANDLGNLLNRTLKMAHKYCQGRVPGVCAAEIAAENPLKSLGATAGDRAAQAYQSLAFDQACEVALALARTGNRFIDEQAPWTLHKQGRHQEVAHTLYAVLESVRLAAFLLAPIVPQLSSEIYRQLGLSFDLTQPPPQGMNSYETHGQWGYLSAHQSLPEPQPVFRKLELPPALVS